MTISQRGTATKGTQPDGTSVSAAKPTGVKNGDVLIAALVSNNQSASAPSGWTKFEDDAVDSFRLQTYYRVAGGFEPDQYTFTVGSAAPLVLTVTAWAGVDNETPIGGAVQTSSGAATEPYNTPNVTSPCTDGRVLYLRAARRADVSPGMPVSFTADGVEELADHGIYSGGSVSYSMALYADEEGFTGAGTKQGLATTASATDTHNVVATIILNQGPSLPQVPVPGGGGGEGVYPPEYYATGVHNVTVTLDTQTATRVVQHTNSSFESGQYLQLVALPAGKGLAYRKTSQSNLDANAARPGSEYLNRPDWDGTYTTLSALADKVEEQVTDSDDAFGTYNSEGYFTGYYVKWFFNKNINPQSPDYGIETYQGDLTVSKTFVVFDLPA